ncbi:MAG: hypothetical protein JO123_09200 [Ktedonobacteraceae bacterium]|nr:hypothetical protein [Ktedonobacteraceae bacterium]
MSVQEETMDTTRKLGITGPVLAGLATHIADPRDASARSNLSPTGPVVVDTVRRTRQFV